MEAFIPHSQYHVCWWPGDVRSQVISNNGIDLILSENSSLVTSSHFYLHGLTLIAAWKSNHMTSKVWDEFTYPFLNFNGATVEV